jgi:hypothetical protein
MKLIVTILFCSFLFVLQLNAQISQPTNFRVLTPTQNPLIIRMLWNYNPNETQASKFVFRYAIGAQSTFDTTTFRSTGIFTFPFNPGRTNYDTIVTLAAFQTVLNQGVYSFTIEARNNDNSVISAPSNIVIVDYNGQNPPKVTFNLDHKRGVCIDSTYSYTCKATSSDGVNDIVYELLESPAGMTINSQTGELNWTPTNVGLHKVRVLGYKESNPSSSDRINYRISVANCDKDTSIIRFLNYPPSEVCVDKQYTYNVAAVTTFQQQIVYELVSPQNLGIELLPDGRFTWTPNKGNVGLTTIAIKASFSGLPNVSQIQRTMVNITDCNLQIPENVLCAVLNGTVKNEDGEPQNIVNGVVSAWRLDAIPNENAKKIFTAPVVNGQYNLQLPAGTNFLVKVYGDNLPEQWNGDVATAGQAVQFPINCTDSKTIDFTLSTVPTPPTSLFVVEGRVIAQKNCCSPLGATVHFLPIGNLGTQIPYTISVDCDPLTGRYVAELPSNFQYYAIARLDGYRSLFYDTVYDATTAKVISIASPNLNSIDFAMIACPGIANGVQGSIVSENGVPIQGTVIIFMTKDGAGVPVEPAISDVRSVNTDEFGSWFIKSVHPGEYMLLCIPFTKEYLPSYFAKNELLSQFPWVKGSKIIIDSVMFPDYCDFVLPERDGLRGLLPWGGKTSRKEAGLMKRGSGVEQPFSTITEPGVIILLKDNDGKVSDFAISDFSGSFSGRELSPGTFEYEADRVGFLTQSGSIDVGNGNNNNNEIELEKEEISVSVQEEPIQPQNTLKLGNPFPNPAKDLMTIELFSKGTEVKVELLTQTSEILSTIVQPMNIGSSFVSISTKSLPSGVYFVKITQGKESGVQKITIVR